MKPMSIFRRSIILLFVILFAHAASAALVDISAHFPKAEYIGQYDQLPGASQVATFSILEPGTVTITAEWSTWYPEIGFGRFGIIWKSPDGSWTDIPPYGETISQVFTSNGRTIEQRDDAKDAPLKEVVTYRVSKRHLPMDKYQVAMQRPNFWEGSHSQKAQVSHMIMDFTPDAGTDTAPVSSQSLTLNKLVFTPGEEISVNFKALASYAENAWIGIIPSSVAHGSEVVNDQYDLTYQYLGKKTSGTLLFTAPQQNGSYDFRMNDSDANGKEVASVSFTVGKVSTSGTDTAFPSSQSLSLNKLVFAPGEEISVNFKALVSYAENAWIGIIPSSVAHGSEVVNDQYDLTYQYLGKKTSGTLLFTAPQQNGSYDFRMNDSDANGKEVASVSFTVRKESISGNSAIVGTWNWFTGTKVYIHPDGTFEAWYGSEKSNYGTWTWSGNKYTLNWVNGGYIDMLTLSSDGRDLDGYNKGGTHITGSKISSSDTL